MTHSAERHPPLQTPELPLLLVQSLILGGWGVAAMSTENKGNYKWLV